MTKIFIPPHQDRTDAINKNLDEQGKRDAERHQKKMEDTTPYKAWRRASPEEVDAEIKHKTKGQ